MFILRTFIIKRDEMEIIEPSIVVEYSSCLFLTVMLDYRNNLLNTLWFY